MLKVLRAQLSWGNALVVLFGAGAGYWMFGARGLGLFMILGALFVMLFGVVRNVSTLAPPLALMTAALAFLSASTLGWGGAEAPDGTRYKASPVGLSHVLTPNSVVSETDDCGWYAVSGYRNPCVVAPDGLADFRVLRAVYPLVLLAVGCCLLGALMSARPAWRLQLSQRVLSASGAGLAVLAVLAFSRSLSGALTELSGLTIGVGGTLGTMQVTVAVLLFMTTSFSPSGGAALLRGLDV